MCNYFADNAIEVQRQWGFCEICRVPINSERQAYEHINGEQHLQNETRKFGRVHDDSRPPPTMGHSPFPRKRYSDESPALPKKRFTEEAASDPISDYEDFGSSSAKKMQRSYSRSPESSRSSPLGEDSQNPKLDRPGINASKHNKPRGEGQWPENPAYIPKDSYYYDHDDRSRDDMNFWERKQMFLQTGRYPPRGRGRLFRGSPSWRRPFIPRGRGRGTFRGRGTGFTKFNDNQASSDVWKHDKFLDEDEEEAQEEKSDKKDKHKGKEINKDEKMKEKKKGGETTAHTEEEKIEREENAMMQDVRVEIT